MSFDTIIQTEVRELTSAERKERTQLCAGIDRAIKTAIAQGRAALWALAEGLHRFDEESGWLALGFENKTAWLAQPDVSLTERTYRRLVHVWRELVVLRGVDRPTLAALAVSKVDIVLPSIKSNEVALTKALADVETLGAEALRVEYTKPSAGPALPTRAATEPVRAPRSKPSPAPPSSASNDAGGTITPPADDTDESLEEVVATLDDFFDHGGDRSEAGAAWKRARRDLIVLASAPMSPPAISAGMEVLATSRASY